METPTEKVKGSTQLATSTRGGEIFACKDKKNLNMQLRLYYRTLNDAEH